MSNNARNPGIGRGRGERIKRPRICECGAAFEAIRSDSRCPACTRLRRLATYKSHHERRSHDKCPGCGERKLKVAKQCRTCTGQWRSISQAGEGNPNWKGGRCLAKDGYVRIRTSRPGKHPYQLEHILVWEAANGPAPKGWHIHHLNGIRHDNRLENLLGISKSDHHKNHHVPWENRIRELEAQLNAREQSPITTSDPCGRDRE